PRPLSHLPTFAFAHTSSRPFAVSPPQITCASRATNPPPSPEFCLLAARYALIFSPVSSSVPEAKRKVIAAQIEKTVSATTVYDIHTHLYDPAFGELLLWGVDDLLTYHYLVAEVFRYLDIPYDKFWVLSKTQQADLIWQKLFIEHSPISEACRG